MREREPVIDAKQWLRFPFVLCRTQYIACHCLFGRWQRKKVYICENSFNASIIVISLHLLMQTSYTSYNFPLLTLPYLSLCLVCVRMYVCLFGYHDFENFFGTTISMTNKSIESKTNKGLNGYSRNCYDLVTNPFDDNKFIEISKEENQIQMQTSFRICTALSKKRKRSPVKRKKKGLKKGKECNNKIILPRSRQQ